MGFFDQDYVYNAIMRRAISSLVLLVAMALPIMASAPADPIVYVTKTGDKYHQDGCRYLRKSKIPKKLSEVKRSYSPCSVCKPPAE